MSQGAGGGGVEAWENIFSLFMTGGYAQIFGTLNLKKKKQSWGIGEFPTSGFQNNSLVNWLPSPEDFSC